VSADDGDMTVPGAPLCVIPSFLRTAEDLDLIVRCLVSIWGTARGADVLVIDDGSPEPSLRAQLVTVADELGYDVIGRDEPEGYARTVNVGLQHALETGRDVVLIDPDVEFAAAGWLERMVGRTDTQGRPAAVVGGRLLFPNGCIEHAGIFFSLRSRSFWHRCRYAPADLPEALMPTRCPVASALQLIRHETLTAVGLYDDALEGRDDVDYCLRVFASGRECIYEPAAVAVHHEPFTGDKAPELQSRDQEAELRLRSKWAGADLSQFSTAIV
jgi:GT2 family glycosyltransferase